MDRNYLIHRKEGNLILSASEIIENAKSQESDGVKPCFKHFALDVPGWLVWSTWHDGAGVVYKRPEDGKYIIVTGWQGEFTFV